VSQEGRALIHPTMENSSQVKKWTDLFVFFLLNYQYFEGESSIVLLNEREKLAINKY
jgi:hypothetical protein